MLTNEELLLKLRGYCDEHGQSMLAERAGISRQYVCDMAHGHRRITEAVAKVLGYKRADLIWEPNEPKGEHA